MEVKTMTIGRFNAEAVRVALMPRSQFLAIVDNLLAAYVKDYKVDLTEKLRPVAEQMERFPFDQWIHPKRGCGCVVGEYLIASKQIDLQARIAVTQNYVEDPYRQDFDVMLRSHDLPTITQLLAQEEDEGALHRFGYDIDSEMLDAVRAGVGHTAVDSVVFIDGE